MALGLPEVNIIFKSKGVSAITRSARGIVACILKDDTEGGEELNVYKSITDVDFTHYEEKNYNYLKLIYEGAPTSMIVLRISKAAASYSGALKKLKDLKWNYLTVPGIDTADVTTISAWIKEQRDDNRKTFKAVLPNCAADHEGVINFTTDNLQTTITDEIYTTSEFCARITGILAGLSLSRSCTYYVLTDLAAADVPEDPDARINAGEFIIIFDGENYKIGRGVNSLVSFTDEKNEDWRKIKIIEGKDLYQDDIRTTYEDYYVGKVINDYDNKQAFVAAVGSYHKELLGDVLDRSYDNVVSIDIEAQKDYLESVGTDTSTMDETSIARANTGSKVFIAASIKFVDAMEDLTMTVSM